MRNVFLAFLIALLSFAISSTFAIAVPKNPAGACASDFYACEKKCPGPVRSKSLNKKCRDACWKKYNACMCKAGQGGTAQCGPKALQLVPVPRFPPANIIDSGQTFQPQSPASPGAASGSPASRGGGGGAGPLR
jgi:hypothetical protein